MEKEKIYLCAFADKRLRLSAKRFTKQAKEMGVYSDIFVYNESHLDRKFMNIFYDKIYTGGGISRGFGYWVWKPYIILKTLENLKDGEILQYTDIGCHLNPKGVKRLYEYVSLANKSDTGILCVINNRSFKYIAPVNDHPSITYPILATEHPESHVSEGAAGYIIGKQFIKGSELGVLCYKENEDGVNGIKPGQWTKGDLYDYFGVRQNERVLKTETLSSVIFIRKCDKSIEILKKWMQVYYDDFALVDDSPSKSANFPDFIEHRHDQSIWSILVALYDVPYVYYKEIYSPFNWDALKEYPIHAKRDRSYITRTKYIKRIIVRVLKKILTKDLYNKLKAVYKRFRA